MVTTKVYNKNTIREHPDQSPQVDGSYSKGHSFVFPGDEIVAHTTITGPDDIGGTWRANSITSAKMSIIAKKINIFSEEFDIPFASTREFELDSFTIAFDGTNAPIVPWGTDGYAPNINFTQDRNWQLPSGDFRRQIKAYTQHRPGSSVWQYHFLFPIIFREDYWSALIAADTDFYDNTQPQNGKNQKWLRYHNLSMPPFGWKIYYKFEFQYTKGIVPTQYTTRSELNLSNDQDSIRDYASNPDYKDLSIKSFIVGGTPSNAPAAFVFGTQNTSVFGYFTKKTAWDAGEKNTLTAVMRIRPFQGGDRLGSRGSSVWPADVNVVWSTDTNNIDTNSGIDITTDGGDNLIIDDNGIPVTISFDSLDDKKVIVKGEIDYNKLNTIFPGITNFTIYCRLYNNTVILGHSTTTLGTTNITGNQYVVNGTTETYVVNGIPSGYTLTSCTLPAGWTISSTGAITAGSQSFDFSTYSFSGTIIVKYNNGPLLITIYLDVYSGSCRMGEEIKQDGVIFIPGTTSPSILACDDNTDTFLLNVFCDTTLPTNPLNNDKSGFYFYGSAAITAIKLQLEKLINNTWTTQTTFIDGTYGKFFAFGTNPDFSGNAFIDDFGKQYTGIFLDWLSVYGDFGVGQFRIKITQSDVFGVDTVYYSRAQYCLKLWDCYNMNGTVRIDTWNIGLRGTMDDSQVQIDYSAGWADQIRLTGIFYETKPDYVKEFNQYGDADFNALRPIIHELKAKFLMDIRPVPGWMDWYLENFVLLADEIFVTDCNSANRKKFISCPVINDGGIDTNDENFMNPLAWSRISLAYGQNNLRKRNS